MPRQTLEYRCLLISPKDVEEERDALTKVVREWNAHVGGGLGARVELVRWESHAVPDMSSPAQEVINRQLVESCDLAIAVFWSRLGTPTQEHPSASVEEIALLLSKGARVLVYFSERAIPQERLDLHQLSELQKIRDRFQSEGLLATYSDISGLCIQVNLHLTSVITQLLAKDIGATQVIPSSGTLTAPTPDVRVTVDAGISQSAMHPSIFALFIKVRNYSPVPVFINNVYFESKTPVGIVVPNGDYISGEYQRPRELQPGRAFMLAVDPEQIEQYWTGSQLLCAAATDEIGRVYRSTESELLRALQILFVTYLKRDPAPKMKTE